MRNRAGYGKSTVLVIGMFGALALYIFSIVFSNWVIFVWVFAAVLLVSAVIVLFSDDGIAVEVEPVQTNRLTTDKAISDPIEALAQENHRDMKRFALHSPHGGNRPARKSSTNCDKRFALIDSEGERRYAQVLGGSFQVGKDRKATPIKLDDFVKAILIDGESGRFTRIDGSQHGILGYGGRSREAVGYELDRSIAATLSLPPIGRL